MIKSVWVLGALFATLAAIFNATVGVISVNLFQNGLDPQTIAFLKCLIALVILLSYTLIFQRDRLKETIIHQWKGLSMCSFFGFFCLYTFETRAYETLNVAVVVFILFSSSMIATFLLSCIYEKRMLNFKEIITIPVSLLGLALIFSFNLEGQSVEGATYAAISGIGYGIFLVLSKRFAVGSSIATLTSLLLFGTIYLFAYWFFTSGPSSLIQIKNSLLPLIFLAILPTIGGFYCTIRALEIIKSQSVQLIELSEPIFAIGFAYIFLSQMMSAPQLIGGAAIILAILIHEFPLQKSGMQSLK